MQCLGSYTKILVQQGVNASVEAMEEMTLAVVGEPYQVATLIMKIKEDSELPNREMVSKEEGHRQEDDAPFRGASPTGRLIPSIDISLGGETEHPPTSLVQPTHSTPTHCVPKRLTEALFEEVDAQEVSSFDSTYFLLISFCVILLANQNVTFSLLYT